MGNAEFDELMCAGWEGARGPIEAAFCGAVQELFTGLPAARVEGFARDGAAWALLRPGLMMGAPVMCEITLTRSRPSSADAVGAHCSAAVIWMSGAGPRRAWGTGQVDARPGEEPAGKMGWEAACLALSRAGRELALCESFARHAAELESLALGAVARVAGHQRGPLRV